jgi:hypothetical protein
VQNKKPTRVGFFIVEVSVAFYVYATVFMASFEKIVFLGIDQNAAIGPISLVNR